MCPSQRRDARLRDWLTGITTRIQKDRSTRDHPRFDGHGLLGAGWHGREHDAFIRIILSWSRKTHVEIESQKRGPGRRVETRVGETWNQSPRRVYARPSGRSAIRL